MGKLTLLVRNSLLALLGFVLIAGGVGYIVSEFVDNQRAVSDVANEIQDVKKGVVEDAANFKSWPSLFHSLGSSSSLSSSASGPRRKP